MQANQSEQNQERQERRSVLHFDTLLFVFLLLGWALIFTTATIALRRDNERWLPFRLVPESSANYSVDAQDAPRLAQVKPQIIEEVRRDEQRRQATPPPPVPELVEGQGGPGGVLTATPTPTLTPTPSPGNLVVSAGGPYETDEGSSVSLMATGFNSVLNVLPRGVTYRWDLDGDGLYDDAEGVSTEVTFYDEGDYPVAVRASDLLGRSAIDLTRVIVNNVPPSVELGPDRTAEEGQEITFLADVSDPGQDILFYEWNFGDGSLPVNGTIQPTHIFRDNGEYTVRLRVSDNDGGQTDAFLRVNVVNLPPLVDAGPDQTVNEGETITFSGTATDPADDPDELSYAWDFDYDGKTFTTDASGQTVSTVYEDGPAEFVVALWVEDEDEGEAIATLKVKVNNVPPVITGVTDNGPVGEGSPLNLEITATDVGQNDKLTYAVDFDDDGNFETAESFGSLSYTWYNQGDYPIRIRVDDGDGGEAFTSTLVSTYNLTPTAVAQLLTSGPIYEGSPANFDSSDSSDPGDDLLTYWWNFGDGQTSPEPSPAHTYLNNGQYQVTLTVRDDSDAATITSIPVTILNANPSIDYISDRTVDEGVVTTYAANASDPGSTDVLTYTWDFNYDGSNFTPDTTGKSVSGTYPDGLKDPKTYLVAVRVQDSDYPNPVGGGQSGEAFRTFKVTVMNVAPIVNIDHDDYFGDQNQEIELHGTATDVPADNALTYAWDLDEDGLCETAGQTVTKAWSKAKTYEVKLCVTDKDEAVGYDTAEVHVNALPLVSISQSLTTTLEGTPIIFDGRGSFDPDGGPLTSYNWTFGDGTGASGITVTHTYTDNAPAPYLVTLRVRDSDNSPGTGAVTVTIKNAPPVALAGPDQTVNENTPLTLNGTATDPGLADLLFLTYHWDFNYDGSNFTPDAVGSSVVWPAADGPAVITAALRVTDKDRDSNIDPIVITVNNVPPVASTTGPYTGTEGLPVTLTGSAIDPLDTVTYAWDLDYDGIVFETPGQSVTYIWNTGGSYTVTLRATDEDGGVGLATTRVKINFRPTVTITGGPYSSDEATPILFNGSGIDLDNDPLTYTWNFGDGTPSQTGVPATHTYADNGTYPVTLQASDGKGGIGVATTTVTINNLPPAAAATFTPTLPFEGEPITFNGSGSTDPAGASDPLSYAWDFGDGATGTGVNVSHSYGDNNLYTATLTVTDGDGGLDTLDLGIVVQNRNPSANAGGPYRTTLGVPTTLTGSGTDVPADTLIYEWDLDYDGVTFDTDATGPATAATWPTAGSRTVALRVTDDDGGTGIGTAIVDVGSPPVANIGGPYTGVEGSPITFDGSGSSDPDGDPLTYTWDFGDGSPPVNGVSLMHTYVDNGDYTVTLQVDDGRGGVDSDSVTVTVTNAPPVALAAASPNPVPEGTPVTFDASGTTDPGSLDTFTYTWDFGDGSPLANGLSVMHTYVDNGDYTVTLQVDDGQGGVDSDTVTVTVNNAPPVAQAVANPNPAPEGTVVIFDASSSTDPGSLDTLTYTWDFGDGSLPANGLNPSYTYADDGSYTVTLTVTDKDGATATATLTITIDNNPPTANAGGPYVTTAGTPVQLTGSGSDIPADPLTYRWDLDNDGTFETNGQIVDFTQAVSGTYPVTLEVSDDDGGVATATTSVQVNSILPFIQLGLPLRRRKKLLKVQT